MRDSTKTLERPASVAPARPAREESWWRARPVAALVVRVLIVVVPIGASVLASWSVARYWSRPVGFLAATGWWTALIAIGSVAMLGTDRVARRFLPLSTLLRMSLVFPDEKPNRFGVALRTGTTRQLEQRLGDLHAHGLVGSERQAAEQLLELVAALRVHDRFTRGHGERVRAYAALLGEELGLDPVELSKLQWAGLIHDIGKLAVPDEILNKPGRLTDEEFDVIKTHPAEGMKLIGPLAPWLGQWALAIGEHHERWDGTGYPARLAGTEISRAGRIVAVADVFDVITAARSYKKPQSAHSAREELARHAGSQFDPEMVRAFLNVSIGRLRTVMWPLSWLAHVPYLGSAVTSPATGVLAPALVAFGSAIGGGALGDAPRSTVPEPPPVVAEVDTFSGGTRTRRVDAGGEPVSVPVAPAGSTTTPSIVPTTTTGTNPTTTTPPTTTAPMEPALGGGIAVGTSTTAPPPGAVPASAPTTAPASTPTTSPPDATTTTAPAATTTLPAITNPTVTNPTVPTIPTTLPPLDLCELLREGTPVPAGADLSGCDLTGLVLDGIDLTGADLTGADLTDLELSDFVLDGADLTGTVLDGARLTDGSMAGVVAPNLVWSAQFTRVDFAGARLAGGSFTDAVLTEVSFDRARLDGADFGGATLTDLTFNDASLRGALLRSGSLLGAQFIGVDATDADFRDADLRFADLRGANVGGADLRRVDLTSANLTGAIGEPSTTLLAIFNLTICPNGFPSVITCWW